MGRKLRARTSDGLDRTWTPGTVKLVVAKKFVKTPTNLIKNHILAVPADNSRVYRIGALGGLRTSQAIRNELKGSGYHMRTTPTRAGAVAFIVGPAPLWTEKATAWSWFGPYQQLAVHLLTDVTVGRDGKDERVLRHRYHQWVTGREARRQGLSTDVPIRLLRHKRLSERYAVDFPGVGRWRGSIRLLAHLISVTYPSLWKLRAMCARMKGWWWDADFQLTTESMKTILRKRPPNVISQSTTMDRAVQRLKGVKP